MRWLDLRVVWTRLTLLLHLKLKYHLIVFLLESKPLFSTLQIEFKKSICLQRYISGLETQYSVLQFRLPCWLQIWLPWIDPLLLCADGVSSLSDHLNTSNQLIRLPIPYPSRDLQNSSQVSSINIQKCISLSIFGLRLFSHSANSRVFYFTHDTRY